MKKEFQDIGIMIPEKPWVQYRSILGWCAKAVVALADRLVFMEFGNDVFHLNEIYIMNNPDTIFDSAILSALIASCCFIYIFPDEDWYPRMQVIDGGRAAGWLTWVAVKSSRRWPGVGSTGKNQKMYTGDIEDAPAV